MLHTAGTSSLQSYSCPGTHSLRQSCRSGRSRNSRTKKICTASLAQDAFQAEVDVPGNEVPEEDVYKQFKNESRRSNSHTELRRRKLFEDHQDFLKRKQRQMHQNRKMQKFDKFLPRLEQFHNPHDGSVFTDVFAESVDDLIGSGEFGSGSFDFGSGDFASDFGPGPLFGMDTSPFLRRVDPQELGGKGETTVGRWGSRRAPDSMAQPRTPVRNDAEQPLTARARKAAQALNAQAKQSTAPPGKPVTAKNQPPQQQRPAPANNGAGKTSFLPINGGKPKTGATPVPPKGQTPAPRKRWQTQRQKKTRAPGAAASDAMQARTPAPGAPVKEKEPVSV